MIVLVSGRGTTRRRKIFPVDKERLEARFQNGRISVFNQFEEERSGGFAEFPFADARFCFQSPAGYPDLQAAPLLCAGLIGYRSLVMAGEGERLGS